MTALARKILSDALVADGWIIPAQSVLDGSDGCLEAAVRVLAEKAERIQDLEDMLHQLIDMDGPMPGNAMWYKSVCGLLGLGS